MHLELEGSFLVLYQVSGVVKLFHFFPEAASFELTLHRKTDKKQT